MQPATLRQYAARGVLKPAKRTVGSGKGGHSRYTRAQLEAFKSQHFGTAPTPTAPSTERPSTGTPTMIELGNIKLKDKEGRERDAKLLALMLE